MKRTRQLRVTQQQTNKPTISETFPQFQTFVVLRDDCFAKRVDDLDVGQRDGHNLVRLGLCAVSQRQQPVHQHADTALAQAVWVGVCVCVCVRGNKFPLCNVSLSL